MSDGKNNPPAITGKVEDNSAFGIYLNQHPEFLDKIERMIERSVRKWTNEFQLVDMAGEIAQEVKLVLLSGIGGLTLLSRSDDGQKRYIGKTAYTQCLKKINERQRMMDAVADKTFDISASCHMPEQDALYHERLRTARKYLKRLTALERKVYVMTKRDEMTLRSIAEKLDISHSYVRVILKRATVKIKGYKANEK